MGDFITFGKGRGVRLASACIACKIIGCKKIFWKLIDKSRCRIVLSLSSSHPTGSAREEEMVFCPGDSDVHEAALFFHLVGVEGCSGHGEDVFFASDDINSIEFQALGGVDGHEFDCIEITGSGFMRITQKRYFFDEIIDSRRSGLVKFFGKIDQLTDVVVFFVSFSFGVIFA